MERIEKRPGGKAPPRGGGAPCPSSRQVANVIAVQDALLHGVGAVLVVELLAAVLARNAVNLVGATCTSTGHQAREPVDGEGLEPALLCHSMSTPDRQPVHSMKWAEAFVGGPVATPVRTGHLGSQAGGDSAAACGRLPVWHAGVHWELPLAGRQRVAQPCMAGSAPGCIGAQEVRSYTLPLMALQALALVPCCATSAMVMSRGPVDVAGALHARQAAAQRINASRRAMKACGACRSCLAPCSACAGLCLRGMVHVATLGRRLKANRRAALHS